MSRLRIGVVGVGALGKHHARILSELPDVELVAVAEPRVDIGRAIADQCRCSHVEDYRDLIDSIDAACVVVPTSRHLQVASDLIRRRIPVLVEKPLALDAEQGRILQKLSENFETLLQVGHIERFNPVTEAGKPFIQSPKYIRTERYSPFPFRSLDIGVVLDVMIHDIDLVLDLCHSPVKSVEAFGISMMGGAEDVAQARIHFEDGCIADLNASRVSPTVTRSLQAWTSGGCVTLDFAAKQVTRIAPTQRLNLGPSPIALSQQPGADIDQLKADFFSEYLKVQTIPVPTRDALTAELQEFVEAVQLGTKPRCGGAEGLLALQTAEKILASIDQHQWEGTSHGMVGPFVRPLEGLRKAG